MMRVIMINCLIKSGFYKTVESFFRLDMKIFEYLNVFMFIMHTITPSAGPGH